MALISNVPEYKEGDDFGQYVERLDFFFDVNKDIIKDDTAKRAVFLSAGVNSQTYNLVKKLLSPTKPEEKNYKELTALLKSHYSPKPSVIVERFKFHSRYRKAGESIPNYIAELRKLTEDCNFCENCLPDLLRDRLVVGINDETIQKRLLSESTLDFQKAKDIAVGMDSAAKNARDITRSVTSTLQAEKPQEASVHHLKSKSKPFKAKGQVQPKKTLQPSYEKRSYKKQCYRCNGYHDPDKCKFKGATCHFCKKVGHISPACKAKSKQHSTHHMNDFVPDSVESEDLGVYTLFCMQETKTPTEKPLSVQMKVNKKTEMNFEIDTGSSASVMSENTYKELLENRVLVNKLEPSSAVLTTYGKEIIPVQGTVLLDLEYEGKSFKEMPILVVQGVGPTLIGRKWLKVIKLNWHKLFNLEEKGYKKVTNRFPEVFSTDLGELKAPKVNIPIGNTQPKFHKARNVPYAMKEKVNKELDRLVEEKIIEPVQYSKWAAPIVPVLKPDGSVRICGDYRLTVNQAEVIDKYPIPKIEDLYAKLSGGKTFTKLDMSQAYLQLPLDEESKDLTTINTQKGLFRYTRLPFGISPSPAIFQRTMDNVLQGLTNVVVYLDDILITGNTEEEHLDNLEKVLQRLKSAGLRLKENKCVFQEKIVKYLGYKIDATGLHPTEEKIKAIINAKTPTNITELKSYLGLLNYYGKFLPNLSTTLQPLYELLRKDKKWNWTEKQEKCFQSSKKLLQSNKLLVHFDPNKELVLACDASPYGIGAVLSHVMEDGTEKPIAFASRTLSDSEKSYSQIEKEGLAIIYGIKKFHLYLYGRSFQLLTDHKPITTLFNEMKGVPTMASNRIQRWALSLSAYNYTIKYKSGNTNNNADALSRLPLPEKPTATPVPQENVFLINYLDNSVITSKQIQHWTQRDKVLSQVYRYILKGWPKLASDNNPELRPYKSRMSELSVYNGCILWGSRVVVPPPGRNFVIQELHTAHPGISRMKSLARSYIWWPKIDKDIELRVRTCENCQLNQNLPPEVPLHSWSFPSQPWSRLHLDFAGPFMNKMFMVLIDAHSKWMEVIPMLSITAVLTIEKLKSIFSTHGLPDTIVTDNGTTFTSSQFQEFIKQNGITHIRSAPFHPKSNGLAEKAVQIFKNSMKKMTGSIESRLSKFLFQYRIIPQTTTGLSTAELLFNRKIKSHLDLLYPDLQLKVKEKQLVQKRNHDWHVRDRDIDLGDQVFVKNYAAGLPWLPGVIIGRTGVNFTVKLDDNREVRRHKDQIRYRHERFIDDTILQDQSDSQMDEPEPVTPLDEHDPVTSSVKDTDLDKHSVSQKSGITEIQEVDITPQDRPTVHTTPQKVTYEKPKTPQVTSELRRSVRTRKPPEKLNLKLYVEDLGEVF